MIDVHGICDQFIGNDRLCQIAQQLTSGLTNCRFLFRVGGVDKSGIQLHGHVTKPSVCDHIVVGGNLFHITAEGIRNGLRG